MKRSSIEWLIDNLYLKDSLKWKNIIEQAKEIHKEEITQAWKQGDGQYDKVAEKMSLEYYNEIYKK